MFCRVRTHKPGQSSTWLLRSPSPHATTVPSAASTTVSQPPTRTALPPVVAPAPQHARSRVAGHDPVAAAGDSPAGCTADEPDFRLRSALWAPCCDQREIDPTPAFRRGPPIVAIDALIHNRGSDQPDYAPNGISPTPNYALRDRLRDHWGNGAFVLNRQAGASARVRSGNELPDGPSSQLSARSRRAASRLQARACRGTKRLSPTARAGYVFVAALVVTSLSVVWIFARHPLYSALHHQHALLHVSALLDQQIAGFVAKLGAYLPMWAVAFTIFSGRRERGSGRGESVALGRRREGTRTGRSRASPLPTT